MFQNFQPILRKSSLKTPGGRFLNHSTVLVYYTCDKQVLWESAGAFFPRDNSLISRGNSHVSRVRGLMVRCLLFNTEVSCSNPWVCAIFYKYSEAEGSDFFRHYETFRLCETFFSKFFKCPQRVLLSIFMIFCKRTNVKKSQRVPFFRIFGTMRLFKILIFFQKFFRLPYFFQNFLMSPKRPPFNFLISCNRTNVIKS